MAYPTRHPSPYTPAFAMDRPDPKSSPDGGVKLQMSSFGYPASSPYAANANLAPLSPMTPSPYGAPTGFGGFPMRGSNNPNPTRPSNLNPSRDTFQPRQYQHGARDSVHLDNNGGPVIRTPGALADFVMSGAADWTDPSPAKGGRPGGRRQTIDPNDVSGPTHYEPPRRSTRMMIASSVTKASGAAGRAFVRAYKEANTNGNSIAFLNVAAEVDPAFLKQIKGGYMTTIEDVFENLPFIEPCRIAAPSNAGVLRIRNIPYATPRSEVTAFVGRNAQVLSQPQGSPYYAVHIIMERHTGKTMDAFVEFSTPAEASSVVNQFNRRMAAGRQPKVGDREVEVEVSNQDELMGELFPRARNLYWQDAAPYVVKTDEMYFPNKPASGFIGFLQGEEVVHMVKHAEQPNRSPFAQRCFIRTYESMLSTIHKYPWFAHEHVSIEETRVLFDSAIQMVRALVTLLRRTREDRNIDNSKPSMATLRELVVAILTCPGFSEKQKNSLVQNLQGSGLADTTTSKGLNMKFGGNSSVAFHWPFQVLAKDPSKSERYVEWVAGIIKKATSTNAAHQSLAQAHQNRQSGAKSGLFGNVDINYGNAKFIKDVGTIELEWIEKMLRRVLPSRADIVRPDSTSSFRSDYTS